MLTTKKERILEYVRAHRIERADVQEIRAIGQALLRQLGPSERTSPSYIAEVLRQAGARVEYQDRYTGPSIQEPYASRLRGLLQFRDLAAAEDSLERLNAIYCEYRAVADRVGTGLVRSLVRRGKQRAESLARNLRVSPEKRREKQEVAQWFRVWLEVPDLFFDWLELRRKSEEFEKLFGRDGQCRHEGSQGLRVKS